MGGNSKGIILDEGEEILVEFKVAFNPGIARLNKHDALLTSKRLIVKTRPTPTSIPFKDILKVELSKWQATGKIITIKDSTESTIGVIHYGGTHNIKTEMLYNWIHSLVKPDKSMEKILEDIKSQRKSFKKTDLFGVDIDYKKPHTIIAGMIILISLIAGGALGAGVGFLIASYMLKTGNIQDISTSIKWGKMLAAIVVGVIIYLLLAVVLMKGINTIFGEKPSPEETALIEAVEGKQQAMEELNQATGGQDIQQMNTALSKYDAANVRALNALEKACNVEDLKNELKDGCNQLDLARRCHKPDIQNIEYTIQLRNPELTHDECITIYNQFIDFKQSSECTKLQGADIKESALQNIRAFCDTL